MWKGRREGGREGKRTRLLTRNRRRKKEAESSKHIHHTIRRMK